MHLLYACMDFIEMYKEIIWPRGWESCSDRLWSCLTSPLDSRQLPLCVEQNSRITGLFEQKTLEYYDWWNSQCIEVLLNTNVENAGYLLNNISAVCISLQRYDIISQHTSTSMLLPLQHIRGELFAGISFVTCDSM